MSRSRKRWTRFDRRSAGSSSRCDGDLYPSRRCHSRESIRSPVRGWDQVSEALDYASSRFRDGQVTTFESVARYVAADLASMLEVEHWQAKVGERDEVTPFVLRVTSTFRREDYSWKQCIGTRTRSPRQTLKVHCALPKLAFEAAQVPPWAGVAPGGKRPFPSLRAITASRSPGVPGSRFWRLGLRSTIALMASLKIPPRSGRAPASVRWMRRAAATPRRSLLTRG